MYAWPQFATNFKLQWIVKELTMQCGTMFTKKLADDDEKKTAIFEHFIDKYNIDMSQYDPEDYRQYATVNDWFVRAIKPAARPMAPGDDVIVAPADARTLSFDMATRSQVWVKGGLFTVAQLLDDVPGGTGLGTSAAFENGMMLISRLAPQDYHRFNMPLAGTMTHYASVSGTFWSVGKDAATSGNYAFYNDRKVMLFNNSKVGSFAYIAVGATCVGSVRVETRTGLNEKVCACVWTWASA